MRRRSIQSCACQASDLVRVLALGTVSALTADEESRRTLSATLEVTGSASLAEQTQDAFHQPLSAFRHPLGWNRQLPTEPDVVLRGTLEWHLRAPRFAAGCADLIVVTSGVVCVGAYVVCCTKQA